jgi:sulfur-carrier protein adenylyltransferase/sulfurtransferase
MNRYERQSCLPELGDAGQSRLRAARVLIIGLGGLGSPVALYLAAAGVGTLGLADFDVVSEHNLQRQILHDTPSVGRPKLASALARLAALNPDTRLVPHSEGITAANAAALLADYDLVVDCADNFATRYLVNDAAAFARVPLVHGSVFQWEGQVTVFAPHLGGPCYRCLHPEPPAAGLVPGCGEAGVLGALCGVVGTMQAMEAIKLLAGVGEPLLGRLWQHDALAGTGRILRFHRATACALCGPQPTITALDPARYAAYACATPPAPAPATTDEETTSTNGAVLLLDVREPSETALGVLPGARLLPLGQLDARAGAEVPHLGRVVVYCAKGGRSLRAVRRLRALGWTNVVSLRGGYDGHTA